MPKRKKPIPPLNSFSREYESRVKISNAGINKIRKSTVEGKAPKAKTAIASAIIRLSRRGAM